MLIVSYIFNSFLIPIYALQKIYMTLKAILLYTCSNYDKRYYRLPYRVPSSSEEDPEDHLFDPEDPRALHTHPQRK